MKTKYFFTLIALCIVINTFSQTKLNDYKYIIVPNSFDFLKSKDQYQLNSLTKFLFNKNGFTAIMEDEIFLQDLVNNGCLALRTDVEKLNGLFKTKLVVVLRNCKNEIVFTSEVGETREKDYKRAYNFALREAFKSFETINYSYKPSIITHQEIKSLEEKGFSKVEVKKNENGDEVKEIVETVIPEVKTIKISNVLYAQEIDNGFQVVDSTPKIVMILLSTPKLDIFIVKGRDAIVYKGDGFWYLSENNGIVTTTTTLNIKF